MRSTLHKTGLKDFLRWLIVEKVLVYGYSLVAAYLKMRVIDVPGEINIVELPKDAITGSHYFHFVDNDFNHETVFKNFKAPSVGKYKIVSFHNSGNTPVFEVLTIALFRRWKLANAHEVLSVAKSTDLRTLGLGDNYYLVALGTIIRRSSALFAICCPVFAFNTIEKEKTRDKRTSIHLHELPNNFSSGHHILFRVS